jgi:hypothetical protein
MANVRVNLVHSASYNYKFLTIPRISDLLVRSGRLCEVFIFMSIETFTSEFSVRGDLKLVHIQQRRN